MSVRPYVVGRVEIIMVDFYISVLNERVGDEGELKKILVKYLAGEINLCDLLSSHFIIFHLI